MDRSETAPLHLRLEVTGGEVVECPKCGKRYKASYLDGLCGVSEIDGDPAS